MTEPALDRDPPAACPACGRTIQGITTRGPNTHLIEPCGHRAPMALRSAVMPTARPDGGAP